MIRVVQSSPLVRAIRSSKRTVLHMPVIHVLGCGRLSEPMLPPLPEEGHYTFQVRGGTTHYMPRDLMLERSPFGGVGSEFFVAETWAPEPGYEESHDSAVYDGGGGSAGRVVYKADERPAYLDDPGLTYGIKRWRPATTMPEWAARLILRVKSVRLLNVQDMDPLDVQKEGLILRSHHDRNFGKCPVSVLDGKMYLDLLGLAKASWDHTWAKKGFPWSSNPMAWRVEFQVKEVKP